MYKAKIYFDKDSKTDELFAYTTVNIGDKECCIPFLLYFYCTKKRKNGCIFCIPWTWNKDAYVLLGYVTIDKVDYPFNLSHSDSTNKFGIYGYTMVKNVKDLTKIMNSSVVVHYTSEYCNG